MAYFEDELRHPRSEDIPLTPENTELHQQLVSGLEANLAADTALTVEVTDTSERSGWFKLPKERYLARVAFLKVNGLGDVAPFQVALELNAHLLDADAATQDPEELARLGYAWPDGVRATLLDRDYSNISHWSSCFQPNAGNIFDYTGGKSGFVVAETPADDIISKSYGISRGLNSGARIAEDGQDRLASFRIISAVLNEGVADTETTDRFLAAVEESDTLQLVSADSTAVANSQGYVDGLLHEAVHTSKMRDMLAWQQYWHDLDQTRS